jgi:hypothetical protein
LDNDWPVAIVDAPAVQSAKATTVAHLLIQS